MQVSENHRQYWSKNLRITGILLAIWFVVTFVVGYWARDLNFTFFGWPFSFWMGGQGALIVYVAHHLVLRAVHEQAGPGTRRCRGGMTWLACFEHGANTALPRTRRSSRS